MSWFEVPEPFSKYYRINESGQVWSIRRNKLLKPSIDRYGYQKIVLTVNGESFYTTVHRLVASTFIPNPNNLPCVNHINENKQDNRVENLEWISVIDNDNYGTRNQRMAKSKCKRPVVQTLPSGIEIHYDGVKDASRKTGIAHSLITKYCKNIGNSKHNSEWRFEYE